MSEYTDETEQDAETHAASALDHRLEALSLLGDFRPAAGSPEAIASAQVHATLAMVDVQIDISRLLSMATRELNANNMFTLASTLKDDNPLREIIQDGLMQHMTKQSGLHTDLTLAMRIQELGVKVKKGDDIVVTSSNGEQCVTLMVIDIEKDEWLFLRENQNGPDNVEVNSPRIHDIFDEDIRGLDVAVKKWP
jgi:hypothetical protein